MFHAGAATKSGEDGGEERATQEITTLASRGRAVQAREVHRERALCC